MSDDEIGRTVQALRKKNDLTQEELAELVGFSAAQTVSDIERGQRAVKAWEVVKLAEALHTSVDTLLGIATQPQQARVLWRRGSGGRSRHAEERLIDRARRYDLLEKWNELPPAPPFPQYELDPDRGSYREAATLATHVGRAFDLGSRPAASLSSVLQEVFRVKLFYEPLGGDESAASARGDFGCAVLMNSAQAPWRRNYNLAHEVFHLVTWDSTVGAWGEADDEPAWLEGVERLANAFASHLLLPADEVEAQFDSRFPDGEIDYPALVEMAREFEVSTEALVWRLRLMGRFTQERAEEILGDPEFRRTDRRSMVGKWDEAPEGPLPPRYWRLALNAYHRGEVTLARLARMLETSVSEVGELVIDDADGSEAAPAPA